MQQEPSDTRRLYLQIADQMAASIRAGEPPQGHRIPAERELAARFGVSRSTVREAMIALETEGLVEIRKGSGVYARTAEDKNGSVADISGPFEILEACLMVEGEAAALAAQRVTQEDIQQLKKLLKRMREKSERRQIEQVESVERAFHLAIAAAARNAAVLHTVYQLWDWRESSDISAANYQLATQRSSDQTVTEHRRILAALQQRDPEAAREAMRAHLRQVVDDFSNYTLE